MSSIIEKADGTVIVTVRITLKPKHDADLIDVVQHAPRRRLAAIIREAMRSGVQSSTPDEPDDEDMDLSGMAILL